MIRLNLLPIKEEQKRIQQVRELVFIVIIVVIIVAGNVVFYQKHQKMVDDQQKIVTELQTQIQSSQAEVTKRVSKEEKRNKEFIKRIEAINSLEKLRKNLLRVLDEINKQMPHKTWIESLDKKGNQLVLVGGAMTYDQISTFAHALKGETRYFSQVNIKFSETKIKQDTNNLTNSRYVSFEIVCDLK